VCIRQKKIICSYGTKLRWKPRLLSAIKNIPISYTWFKSGGLQENAVFIDYDMVRVRGLSAFHYSIEYNELEPFASHL